MARDIDMLDALESLVNAAWTSGVTLMVNRTF